MDNFVIFEKMFKEYNNTKNEHLNKEKDSKKCLHYETCDMNGKLTCSICGEELRDVIGSNKEWRYYSNKDNKRSSDPTRIQVRKINDKNIYKDVERLGFNETILSTANSIYKKITNGKIFRGNSRKAIIFACIFNSFKINNDPQPYENLIRMFSLDKKTSLKGLKYVNLHSPRESNIQILQISPANLIISILNNLNAGTISKNEILELYEKIKNKSSNINRSRPQSVAAGLIFYWICKNKIPLNIKEFAKKTNLSELTIQKNVKEIKKVLGENE
jgi:transcription initiation factor TFIIIB Brf1 subunit/transcription initiation factor TFIIB